VYNTVKNKGFVMKGHTGGKALLSPVLYVAIFILLSLYFGSKYFFLRLVDATSLNFHQYLMEDATRWLPWPFLVPLVLWLGRRIPLAGKRRVFRILAHLGGSVGVSVIQPALAWFLIFLTPDSWWAWRSGGSPSAVWGLDQMANLFVWFFHLNVLTYWAILGVQYGLDYYRRYREREIEASRLETQLVRARLQALSAQIHPHFLFNTLHMISALVHRKPQVADRMITRLSELLRVSLDRTDRQEIALREELDTLMNYVEIMKTRFEDRLEISFDVSPDVERALVPYFILQPLVENAIHHGVMPRGTNGKVRISAEREGGDLIVDVVDNGRGFPEDPRALIEKGQGLRITGDRLRHLYGERASLRAENGAGGGARVTLTIPFHEQVTGGTGAGGEGA